ncbi:MAG: GcvT family protein, partial [bacterium]
LYIRDDSGGLLVGCFEPIGKAINPDRLGPDFSFQLLEEDWDHFEPMLKNALHRLPVLQQAEARMLLNGPESFTPDGSFLLGETGETRGLFLGCGMNSVGVASAGGAGMALARCIVEGQFPMDLHELDPKRFPDCFNSAQSLAERVPEVLGKHYEITFPGRQWNTARNLRFTPLHQRWCEKNAYFGQFYGWERPLFFDCEKQPVLSFERPQWFEQVGKEVALAHSKAAIFDQSTFGKIRVSGIDAETFLNRVCANAMDRPPGSVIYTGMLNERGGFISDLTVQRIATDDYLLFVGTSAIKHDLVWLNSHVKPGERVRLINQTDELATVGLMGQESEALMASLGVDDVNTLGYFRHREYIVGGIPLRAARLSYVGECGWEFTCRSNDVSKLYDLLRSEGAQPAGLFAQTSMRVEKAYLSYGHDLDTDINPIDSGLDFAVDWNSDFIGKQALQVAQQAPLLKTRVSIMVNDPKANPIGNEPVYYDGQIVGQTTSAAFGFRVGCPVAIAYLKTEYFDHPEDLIVELDLAGNRAEGRVVVGAVFDPSGTRLMKKS